MKKLQLLNGSVAKATATAITVVACAGLAAHAAQFKLGAEASSFINNPPPLDNHYPAPQTLDGGAAATYDNPAPQQRQPLRASASVSLPPQFMGSWLVQGRRTGVEAAPQYQNGIGGLFQSGTQNTWNISGNAQQGYQMSNDLGVSTQLTIYKVSKNTAFIRYQHPISKTMAQEAIVMELQNGGATFQGLERISIVKEGEPQPRAKITYQLIGQRQR